MRELIVEILKCVVEAEKLSREYKRNYPQDVYMSFFIHFFAKGVENNILIKEV